MCLKVIVPVMEMMILIGQVGLYTKSQNRRQLRANKTVLSVTHPYRCHMGKTTKWPRIVFENDVNCHLERSAFLAEMEAVPRDPGHIWH